jgi:DNA-binding MarR family transcriptional regulator
MKERPGRYTTSELVDMLGLNKTTVISVMKRAVEMDPSHVKLTQGKRRKLYLSYTPEDQDLGENKESETASDDADRMRLELMSMT